MQPGSRRWASVFLQAGEPTVVYDAQARILLANPAWQAMTGRTSDEVVGKTPAEVAPGGDGEKLPGIPAEALGGKPAATLALIVHRDGSRTWRKAEYLPFHDRDGRILGILAIFREPDAPSTAEVARSREASVALEQARERLRGRFARNVLIGSGTRHERLLRQVEAARGSRIPVLIVGEPGTGRRHVARAIHHREGQAVGPLVPFDPAAIPPDRLERELFGPEPDAALALPEDASLLLIDAGKMPRDLQARLVPALQSGRLRILATTAVDPDAALGDDSWRRDFYHGLTVMVIRLAPLRERLDELPILAQHFLNLARGMTSDRPAGILPETLKALSEYDWPGNLRELARVMEAANERGKGEAITVDDLPAAIRGDFASSYAPPPLPIPAMPLDSWLADVERRMIEQALRRAKRSKSKAADLLEISRPRLNRRIKELGIADPNDEPPAPPGNLA